MHEIETSLQEFGEILLKARLDTPKAAPPCVRWVRRSTQYTTGETVYTFAG